MLTPGASGEPFGLLLCGLAAVAAGAINALAGGGTLLTFPVLTALGLPAVGANITNTIAIAPGHLGATLAQKRELLGQRTRLLCLVPAGLTGGLAGALLLLFTSEKAFRQLVPFLILLASALLAVQEPLRRALARRTGSGTWDPHEGWSVLPVFLASIYGGYFGAGLSVIVLAALGLVISDSLTRLNTVKQAVGFAANAAAAALFLFSGQVAWTVALVMAVGAVAGGALGGRLAGRVRPATLRIVVVSVGTIVGLVYLARG